MNNGRIISLLCVLFFACATCFSQEYLGKTSAEVMKLVEQKTDDYAKSTSHGFDQVWFGTSGRNGATYFISFNKQKKCFIEHIITTSKQVAESFMYNNYIVQEFNKNSIPVSNGKTVVLYQANRNPFGGVNYNLYIYNNTDEQAVKAYLNDL